MRVRASLFVAILVAPASAQQSLPAQVDAWVDAHRAPAVGELVDFMRLPNVASDLEDIRANAAALRVMMERRGIATWLIETGGAPMVYGELDANGATTTLLFYAHYDGQPVDPADWVGHRPFEPILRAGKLADSARIIPLAGAVSYRDEWRLYGRSATDDKAPIVALLTAIDALRAAGAPPST
ncbi:MAG: hypothetical protein ACRELV_13655 [Longimicrobiales bacterium]